jgi:hypothetical protein
MRQLSTEPRVTFPEWAAQEVSRLLHARERARTATDRAQVELQLAILCDAAHRYGNSLAENSEI